MPGVFNVYMTHGSESLSIHIISISDALDSFIIHITPGIATAYAYPGASPAQALRAIKKLTSKSLLPLKLKFSPNYLSFTKFIH